MNLLAEAIERATHGGPAVDDSLQPTVDSIAGQRKDRRSHEESKDPLDSRQEQTRAPYEQDEDSEHQENDPHGERQAGEPVSSLAVAGRCGASFRTACG